MIYFSRYGYTRIPVHTLFYHKKADSQASSGNFCSILRWIFCVFSPKNNSVFYYEMQFHIAKSERISERILPAQNSAAPMDCAAATLTIFYLLFLVYLSANTLSHHSVCNLFKTCCIGTYYIVSFEAVFLCSVCHIVADIYHNAFQLFVYLFKAPA